ncbi:MAG: hypothetical protein KDD42_03720, partial [Bdellovibrionales bacterium]|nr:hypothetical protein [Bdellovibrionales bacterium]
MIKFAVLAPLVQILFLMTPTQSSAEMVPVPGTSPQLLVSNQHPRILINPQVRSELRCRAGLGDSGACASFGNASQVFQAVKSEIDSDFNNNKKGEGYIDQYAFLYQLTGNTSYCDLAIESALEVAAARDCDARPSDCDAESLGFGRISPVALVYDWCYSQLSSSERAILQDDLLDHTVINPIDDTHPEYPHAETITFGFAIFGDVSDSRISASIAEHYNAYKNIFLPAAAEIACDGGYDGYA